MSSRSERSDKPSVVRSVKPHDQKRKLCNGGPNFRFNEAISLQVRCETQAEVDYFWSKLSQGGEEGPCGWLKDKYGLSWAKLKQAYEGQAA